MREKALLKQHLNKQQVTLQTDYMPMPDLYLQKTGLRGRKGLLFYALVVLLFAVALINLAVSRRLFIFNLNNYHNFFI